jgi:hypothetical protein
LQNKTQKLRSIFILVKSWKMHKVRLYASFYTIKIVQLYVLNADFTIMKKCPFKYLRFDKIFCLSMYLLCFGTSLYIGEAAWLSWLTCCFCHSWRFKVLISVWMFKEKGSENLHFDLSVQRCRSTNLEDCVPKYC